MDVTGAAKLALLAFGLSVVAMTVTLAHLLADKCNW